MKNKKQNLLIILVVLGILSIAGIFVMMTTTKEVNAVAAHTCGTCSGTGLCNGTEGKISADSYNAKCPNCSQLACNIYHFGCNKCGFTNTSYHCTSCNLQKRVVTYNGTSIEYVNDGAGGVVGIIGLEYSALTNIHPYNEAISGGVKCLCTVCNGTKKCSHELTYKGQGSITGYHEVNCTVCGYVGNEQCETETIPEAGNYVNHIEKCTICQRTYYGGAHTVTSWTNSGNKHTGTCTACSMQITKDHTYGAWTDAGNGKHKRTCTVTGCNAVESNAHTYGAWTDAGNGNHKRTCTVTGCNYSETEAHIDNEAPIDKCDKCGVDLTKPHEHNYNISAGYINKTEKQHTPVSKCACGDTKNGTPENHTWDNGICTKCEYECKHTNIDNNGTCEECGKSTAQPHEHNYNISAGYTNKTEKQHTPVSKCACGDTKNGTPENHTWDNGICTKCEYECKHTDADNNEICDICNKNLNCTHKNLIAKYDDTYHWDECADCGEKLNKEKHNYINGKCECGKVEETSTDDSKKEESKNENTEKEDENKNATKKDDTKQDTSATNKDIPYTGSETIIGAIIITVALMAVGLLGLKKYKE